MVGAPSRASENPAYNGRARQRTQPPHLPAAASVEALHATASGVFIWALGLTDCLVQLSIPLSWLAAPNSSSYRSTAAGRRHQACIPEADAEEHDLPREAINYSLRLAGSKYSKGPQELGRAASS